MSEHEQLTLHEALGTEPANTPIDWGRVAQSRGERHLDACQQALWCSEGECDLHANSEDVCASPASAPFCGCLTCEVREVLHAAWPCLLQAAREEAQP